MKRNLVLALFCSLLVNTQTHDLSHVDNTDSEYTIHTLWQELRNANKRSNEPVTTPTEDYRKENPLKELEGTQEESAKRAVMLSTLNPKDLENELLKEINDLQWPKSRALVVLLAGATATIGAANIAYKYYRKDEIRLLVWILGGLATQFSVWKIDKDACQHNEPHERNIKRIQGLLKEHEFELKKN